MPETPQTQDRLVLWTKLFMLQLWTHCMWVVILLNVVVERPFAWQSVACALANVIPPLSMCCRPHATPPPSFCQLFPEVSGPLSARRRRAGWVYVATYCVVMCEGVVTLTIAIAAMPDPLSGMVRRPTLAWGLLAMQLMIALGVGVGGIATRPDLYVSR